MIVQIGIIGAGVFGNYHAQKITLNKHARLVGFYDANIVKSTQLAKAHNCTVYPDLDDLLEQVDTVIIASPAKAHYKDGYIALRAGKHCLIEKPLATHADEARDLIHLAKRQNLVLQVGHQERFILKAVGIDKIKTPPTALYTQRFSPYSPRGSGISVTQDLMIHDIDLAIWLMGGLPKQIKGYAHKIISSSADTSLAFLEFANGKARLDANRVAPQARRRLIIDYPQGRISLDFLQKTCINTTPFDLNKDFTGEPLAQDLRAHDPLRVADDAFISSIVNGTDICVTGEDGLQALQTALEIDASAARTS